jgi:phosphatidylserine/phosphatidylglycerophosphate/cardiolipin synthase-like enzyme
MKHLLLALLLLSPLLQAATSFGKPTPTGWSADLVHTPNSNFEIPTISAFFSPNGGCTEAIVDQLNEAKRQVLVQAYSFTSAPIAKALVDAHRRGVDVQVILDKSQRTERYSGATFLSNEGIPVFIDAAHKIAHNKVMVVDGKTVITGSFNFTKSAEEGNAENLLVISNAPDLAQRYTANWKEHLLHSTTYNIVNSTHR